MANNNEDISPSNQPSSKQNREFIPLGERSYLKTLNAKWMSRKGQSFVTSLTKPNHKSIQKNNLDEASELSPTKPDSKEFNNN